MRTSKKYTLDKLINYINSRDNLNINSLPLDD